MKGRKEDISNEEMKKQLEPLKQYWSDPKLDENEAFLKDFFLNKRWKKYNKNKSKTPHLIKLININHFIDTSVPKTRNIFRLMKKLYTIQKATLVKTRKP